MNKIQELYSKLETYCKTAMGIYEKNTKDGEWLNSKEETEFLKLSGKIADVQSAISSIEGKGNHDLPLILGYESMVEAVEIMNHPVGNVIYPLLGGDNNDTGAASGPFIKAESKKFVNMFGKPSRSGEFRNFKDFALAIKAKDTKRLYNAVAGGSEGVGAGGGFLVPEEFSSMFIDGTIENSVMLPGCTIYPMKSASRIVPAWDGADHSSGLLGGMAANWIQEGGDNDVQYPKARQITLNAKKLVIIAAATQELAEDAPDYESNLQNGLTRVASWKVDDALIHGTGNGQPLGIMNSPSLIGVNPEAGQAITTILYENVIKMMARLHPSCWNNAVWLAHPSTLPQLMLQVLVVGTGGSEVKAFTFQDGTYRLLGRPLFFTEKCQPLGTKGDLILVDRSQYLVGMRKDIVMDTSIHVHFTTVQNAYRCVMRLDGIPAWDKAVTPARGTDTLSWAVVLNDRV